MNPVDYLQMLRLAAPETIVTVTMLLVLGGGFDGVARQIHRGALPFRRAAVRAGLRLGGGFRLHPARAGGFAQRHPHRGPADRFREGRDPGADDLHHPDFHLRQVHGPCGRISFLDSAGHHRPDVSRQRRGFADDLRLAGTRQPGALHPHRVQQAQCPLQRGGVEILSVRRHVGGVSAVRLQPAVRHFRFHQFDGRRAAISPARASTRCCWSRWS